MDHHEKLAWSAQHLHALDLEIKEFLKRHPFRAVATHRDGTRAFDVTVEEMPLLPAHWPLMAGDAIHNIRSGLDYLIWALIDKAPTKPNAEEALKVGYPICTKKGKYWGEGDQFPNNGARMRLAGRWIDADALAVIDSTQPYLLGDLADEHPLAVIAAYSNEDKHRNLVACGALAVTLRFRFSSLGKGRFVVGRSEFTTIEEWWFESGAELGTLKFDEVSTCENMKVEPIFQGTVAFSKAQDTMTPPFNVAALEEVLYALHRQVIAPLDAILVR